MNKPKTVKEALDELKTLKLSDKEYLKLSSRYLAAIGALEILVEAKEIKEEHGKTDTYLELKDLGWSEAERVLKLHKLWIENNTSES